MRSVCYDCGEITGATLRVYRMMQPEVGPAVKRETLVHRAGTGCHKGMTTSEVREVSQRLPWCPLCRAGSCDRHTFTASDDEDEREIVGYRWRPRGDR